MKWFTHNSNIYLPQEPLFSSIGTFGFETVARDILKCTFLPPEGMYKHTDDLLEEIFSTPVIPQIYTVINTKQFLQCWNKIKECTYLLKSLIYDLDLGGFMKLFPIFPLLLETLPLSGKSH